MYAIGFLLYRRYVIGPISYQHLLHFHVAEAKAKSSLARLCSNIDPVAIGLDRFPRMSASIRISPFRPVPSPRVRGFQNFLLAEKSASSSHAFINNESTRICTAPPGWLMKQQQTFSMYIIKTIIYFTLSPEHFNTAMFTLRSDQPGPIPFWPSS